MKLSPASSSLGTSAEQSPGDQFHGSTGHRYPGDSNPCKQSAGDPSTADVVANPCQLLQDVKRKLFACQELHDAQLIMSAYLQRHLRTPLIAWYYPPVPQAGADARIESLVCPMDGLAGSLRGQLKEVAAAAVKTGQLTVQQISRHENLYAMACPLLSSAGHCLLTLLESPEVPGGHSVAFLQLSLTGTVLEEWFTRKTCAQAHRDASDVAALIEMISRTHAAADAASACQRLADQLQEFLKADRVFVGLCRDQSSEPRLICISGEREFDPLAESTRLTEAVLHESIARSATAIWPALDLRNRHVLMSHQQLAEFLNCRHLVSVPLISEEGQRAGAIVASFGDRIHASPAEASRNNTAPGGESDEIQQRAVQAERVLRAGATSLTSCLEVVQRLADSHWIAVLRRTRRFLTTRRLRSAGVIMAICGACLLIPADYRIRCHIELQPIERRYVAAPFTGPLEECLVEPGDVVEAAQLLARMDAREIQWELAGVRADLHKATKERNTHLNSHDFADAAISRYEVERLQTRSDMLQHRDSNLEIRSPISGLIVSGNHREAEGVTLDQGQTLFEVAPLDRMMVEVSLPEEDLRHVRTGMRIQIQLDALPEQILEATVARIHPRAELRDHENVFIAEAELDNQQQLLRPGMRGTARVIAASHPLGWNWFHKPIAHVIGWLGW